MSLLHLRVISPVDRTDGVLAALHTEPGAASVAVLPGAARQPVGDLVLADLARECVPDLLDRLHDLGIDRSGSTSLSAIDTAISAAADRAERDAPGEGSGVAVGLLLGRRKSVRRGLIALVVGFPVAMLAVAAVAALWRVAGLVDAQDLVGARQAEFIYHPGRFSVITAVVAGAAGTLSLTSARSAALIGVFISVTTIPAAGNVSVALVFGQWSEAGGSLLQLVVNLLGIIGAAYLLLLGQSRWQRRHRH